jgi:hypothetical protein
MGSKESFADSDSFADPDSPKGTKHSAAISKVLNTSGESSSTTTGKRKLLSSAPTQKITTQNKGKPLVNRHGGEKEPKKRGPKSAEVLSI